MALGISVFVAFDSSINQSANIAEVLPISEPMCENADAIEDFVEPVSVVWKAKMDGCLVSCEGASFTRIPEDSEYPHFAGYFPENFEKEISGEDVLEITGDWIGVGADHPFTVFNNKCVPIVRIKNIEPVK